MPTSIEARLTAYSTPAIVPGLERTRALLKRLGHPERGLKAIHVAGSNGKGSVCRMIESVLGEAGYRTGLFISPHLIDFTERFRLNGKSAARKDLERAGKPLWKAMREQAGAKEGAATYFEAITALAFLYFKQQKVDVLVLETGLGGRLDSTNVLSHPLLTVITNISLEHTSILGKTEAKIAWEKAGIIKKGSPLVSTAQGVARQVIRKQFRRVQQGRKTVQRSLQAGKDWQVSAYHQDPAGQAQTVTLHLEGRKWVVALPLLGRHQHQNLACALAALELLPSLGVPLDEMDVLRGLAAADWPARCQVLGQKPLMILDGAHNPAGARALAQTIADFPAPYARRALVVGVLKDKDWRRLFKALNPVADRYFLATPPDPRGLEASVAAAWLAKQGRQAQVFDSLPAAVAAAKRWAGSKGLVVAAGSLYNAGVLLRGRKL
jgi:dihydrofolate synthase/folylpolyglutamate synthase